MSCQTCTYFTSNKYLPCAVDPIHYANNSSGKECKQYEYDESKPHCGNCAAFNGSRCRITYMYVESGYPACFNYMSDSPKPQTISAPGEKELLFQLIQELDWVEVGSKSQTTLTSIGEMQSLFGEFYDLGIITYEENGEVIFIIWDENNPNNLTLTLHTEYTF